jgi:hypothetical protein
MSRHHPNCRWPNGRACREFSTDGTQPGADIAHTMGTTDEDEIIRLGMEEDRRADRERLTGMEDEQRDWEADE